METVSNNPIVAVVLVVMAVSQFLQPIFFGALFFFMFRWFPTRKETELQEQMQAARHSENQMRFQSIENDIKKLLSQQGH